MSAVFPSRKRRPVYGAVKASRAGVGSSLAGQTGVETAIATARLFLGVRASSLGLQKALGALYNFPAGSQVVGCKAGPQSSDEVGCPAKPG